MHITMEYSAQGYKILFGYNQSVNFGFTNVELKNLLQGKNNVWIVWKKEKAA